MNTRATRIVHSDPKIAHILKLTVLLLVYKGAVTLRGLEPLFEDRRLGGVIKSSRRKPVHEDLNLNRYEY